MNFYLSFSDLALLDDWKGPDAENFKQILYTNGLDSTKPFDIEYNTHRNLRNEIVEDYRVDGFERTDKKWRQSGAASIHAYIDDSSDVGFQKELRRMNKVADMDYYKRILEKDI